MQDFAERLNQAMSAKHLSLRDISDETGISYEMVRRYSKGDAKPRSDKIKLIADCLGIAVTWLDYGEGQMAVKPAIDEHSLTEIKENKVQAANTFIGIEPSSSTSTIELIETLKEMEKNGELTPQVVGLLNNTLNTVKSISGQPLSVAHLVESNQ